MEGPKRNLFRSPQVKGTLHYYQELDFSQITSKGKVKVNVDYFV